MAHFKIINALFIYLLEFEDFGKWCYLWQMFEK